MCHKQFTWNSWLWSSHFREIRWNDMAGKFITSITGRKTMGGKKGQIIRVPMRVQMFGHFGILEPSILPWYFLPIPTDICISIGLDIQCVL